MKREAISHTKMKRLCRRLKIPLWQAVGIMESLWHLTSREAPRGDIGKLSNEDIAIGIEYGEDEDILIDALVDSGWFEAHPEYRLVVHDWHEHADDALNMRLARARQYFVGEIPPKTSRLGKFEREQADTFYASVRTDRQSVHTRSALDERLPGSPPSPAIPRLTPPSPPPPSLPCAHGEFPATAAALREKYPDTGDVFVMKLTMAVGQMAAGENGKLKGDPTDQVIADAVRYCADHSPKQNSAGLFLTTVPQCVRTWLTQDKKEPERKPNFSEIFPDYKPAS